MHQCLYERFVFPMHLVDVGKTGILDVVGTSSPILTPQEADNGSRCLFAGAIPLEAAIPSTGRRRIGAAGR